MSITFFLKDGRDVVLEDEGSVKLWVMGQADIARDKDTNTLAVVGDDGTVAAIKYSDLVGYVIN
jgi:hypothetical protein